MFRLFLCTIAFATVSQFNLYSQSYVAENHLRYENYEYNPNIKTVLLHKDLGNPFSTNDQLADEVISLNTNDKLLLSFDDLEGGTRDYSYTFIHCDAHWQPSDVDIFSYIKGYTDDRITDYHSSYNTIQSFTHYNLSFPNENIRLTKSGNYIIMVYADNDKEKLVLTRRFMIVDRHVSIKAQVNPSMSPKDHFSRQQIDFRILYSGYQIFNPFDELNVVIRQNGRWDNVLTDIKPVFLKDNELDYQFQSEIAFNGGNEYRWFDTRTLKILTERTAKLFTDSLTNMYHVFLLRDGNRAKNSYFTNTDLNGNYFIHTQDGSNPDLESEYAYIHFLLPYDSPQTNGNIYIFGGLTDWTIKGENKLTYNPQRHAYEGTMYVKQGYYNYQYLFMDDKAAVADETFLEGNHYETENDYTIYVYDHPIASRIDLLIGIIKINSVKRF